MLNRLLSIALTAISLAFLSACTAASAPGQGGISIPNLVTVAASPTPDSDALPADYVFVDAVDPDFPNTSLSSSPRVILAVGRNRGSVRLASTGELLVAIPYSATRYTLVDMNADGIRDLVILNSSAGPTEYGFRAFDMQKILAEKTLVDLGKNYSGAVYGVAEFGSNLLLAVGDKVTEVAKTMTLVRDYTSIAAKDVMRLHIKPGANDAAKLQFLFHTTNDCGSYSYCIEIYNNNMSARTSTASTDAQPGKHLSIFGDDIDTSGTVDALYVSNGDRTTELYYDSTTLRERNLTTIAPGFAAIASATVSGRNMWNRGPGSPRDLLITAPLEGGGASATIYKERVHASVGTQTFEADTVLTWALPTLRSALTTSVFHDDDILLMESGEIHVLEGELNPDLNLEYFARYIIAD